MNEQSRQNRLFLLFAQLLSLLAFGMIFELLVRPSTVVFWRTMGAAAIATLVIALLADFFSRQFRSSRNAAAEVLHEIAAGNLDQRAAEIELLAGSHELATAISALVIHLERTIFRFSQLSTDVAAVSEQISKRSGILAKTADENLRSSEETSRSAVEIDISIGSVQDSTRALAASSEETSTSILQMSASIEEVGRISQSLSEFVEQTASGIEEMSASINQVAVNTEGFSSFAIETASSMVQMNATTDEIRKSARHSSELSRHVTEAASEGRRAVTSTVEGMEKIQQSVEEAKQALNLLAERSGEIGEIVRVIDEIAGQTNLLALNAAIIAAQAGERGKGFAVVADEIGDLSERTSASTDEIRTLIQNVQRGVARAAEQMNLSGERVSEGVALTARADQVLGKILELTDRSTHAIAEIAKATEEQARGSQEATRAIAEVTKMVQQTAIATQQQSDTSKEIGAQAARVRDYTKHLQRAMEEQQSGSQTIARAMDAIMGAVTAVVESTSVLSTESASIVRAMGVNFRAAGESAFSVSELNQMANVLHHETSLFENELSKFQLPTVQQGGSIVTASVLPVELTLDPVHCQFLTLQLIQKSIHETLVQFGEGAELVAGLAERWEILEQGTRYRFHLRGGVRFHNGRPLTANDVRASFLRLISPETKSTGKWIMHSVKGADDVMEGRTRTAAGLLVTDERTVEFVLTEPLAFFLLLLSMPEAAIVPVEEARDPAHFRLHAIGAGPFFVEEAVAGSHVKLRRNPHYYQSGRPHVDELRYRLDLKGGNEVAEAFLRGELDLAPGLPLKIVSQLRKDPRHAPYLLDTVQLHTSYLAWDCSSPPFDRVEVRQAVSYAINRQRINEQIFSGLGIMAASLLPPGLLGYENRLQPYPHDPGRAKDLMQAAGLRGGFPIDYWTWDTDEFYNSGQIPLIIEDLAAISIDVRVTKLTAAEARSRRSGKGHGSLFAGNWFADFPDSDNFFYMFFHSQSAALPGINYQSEEIDRSIEEARRTIDQDRRTSIYRKLNEKVQKEAAMVYLFHDRYFAISKSRIHGMRISLVPPPVRYSDVWIER